MNDKYKKILRTILIFCKLDLTNNLHYDRLTEEIMHKVISEKSNCIDVGAHKGEILETILKLSPQGKHYAFASASCMASNSSDLYLSIKEMA